MMNHQSIEMRAICLSNNTGVLAFENGKLDEAMDFFRDATSAVSKQSFLKPGNENPSPERSSNQGHKSGTIPSARRTNVETRSPSSRSPCDHTRTNNNTSRCPSFGQEDEDMKTDFVYLHPMRVEEDLSQYDRATFPLSCSLICIFNLAVTSHARAIQTIDRGLSFSRLNAAKKLYELSYTMFLMQEGDMHIEMMFVALAILNNVGVVHKQMQRTTSIQEAHQCFEQLLSCFIYSMRGGFEPNEMYMPSRRASLDGFLSNIIRELNILKPAVTAPSA
jgi:hypothetical protein